MSVFLDGKKALSNGLKNETLEIRLQTSGASPSFTKAVTSADFTVDVNGRLRLADPVEFTITGISSSTTFTRVTLVKTPGVSSDMVELTLDEPVTFTTNGTLTLNNINVDYS